MLIRSCFRKAFFTVSLLGALSSLSNAQTFEQIDIQVVFNIHWEGSPSQRQIELGMDSSSDTWTTRFTIFGSSLPVSTNCSNGSCSNTAHASEQNNNKLKISIQSTTEPDLSVKPFRHDAFRSLDEFEYFSDGSTGYIGLNDVLNGVYANQGGTQLESWILERNIFGLNTHGEIYASSQALLQFLTSGNATFDIQENFLNSLQQISYSKSGTATVASALMITAQNNPYPLECSYNVISLWNGGFQSNVTLKNVSNIPVKGWLTTIKFADAVYIDNVWNASMTGFIPDFNATNASWNETIYPGQSITFGFVGSKATSQTADAIVSGKLCR